MDKYAKEAQFTTLPIARGERPYGFFDSSLVNIGWGIATWCFLTGGLLASIVDFKTAFLATLAGNIIGVALVALSSTVVSFKYGIDTYTSIISFFGRLGMKIVLAIFIITNLGWVVVLASMCARSTHSISRAISGLELSNFGVTVLTIIAVLVIWLIVVKGPAALKIMNRIMVPGLVIVTIIMAFTLASEYSFKDILAAQPIAPYPDARVNKILAFELSIGAGVSWWPGLGALGRLNKKSSSAFWGNMIGLCFACVILASLSAATAFVIGSSDPTEWMIPLGGIAMGIVALIFVMIANITSGSFVMYNTCLGLKNFVAFANKKWGIVCATFVVPVIALSFFQDFVYGHYNSLLNLCVALFGPLAVIQVLDFYVFKKHRIDLRAIYDLTPTSEYWYHGGVNRGGIAIFILSVITYCLLLNPITWEYSTMFTYFSATLPSCLFCCVAYYVYAKLCLAPKNIGGFRYHEKIDAAQSNI